MNTSVTLVTFPNSEISKTCASSVTLNSLLTLLPKEIYIHLTDNCIDEFINTLQLIFEKRVHICMN